VSEPLLEVTDLKKYFPIRSGLFRRVTGHVKAVDGVSFAIDPGETLAIIGESGSGKSTVAKTIIGIHGATDGSIRLNGKEITNPSSEQANRMRKQMQMVFQDPTSSLNPRRSIRQSLMVPLKAQGMPKDERAERISELLEVVDLNDEYLYKYPHELSGGQKQRINIARAISIEPEILLLDEPTSALDVSVQAKIIRLLEELQNEYDLTYLFITHDLSLVRNVADETAVMYLGQFQEKGDTNRVFNEPKHPYTRALLSSIPVTSDEEESHKPDMEPLEGEIPSPRDIPSGCRFHTRCPYAVDTCSAAKPDLIPDDDGDLVRCHIYDGQYRSEFPEIPPVAASDGGSVTSRVAGDRRD
jgi:oligopeptide transport system ATP-binding protein